MKKKELNKKEKRKEDEEKDKSGDTRSQLHERAKEKLRDT